MFDVIDNMKSHARKQSWRDECLKRMCGFVHAGGGRMVSGVRGDEGDVDIPVMTRQQTVLDVVMVAGEGETDART